MKKNYSLLSVLLFAICSTLWAENKEQIHLDNKSSQDVVLSLTWRGLEKPHLRRDTVESVKKGKSLTVKSSDSHYKLEKISVQSATQVGIEAAAAVAGVGLMVGTAGAAAAAGAAAGAAAAAVGATEAAVDAITLAVGGAYLGAQITAFVAAGDLKASRGKAYAHEFNYFTFKNSPKSNKKDLKSAVTNSQILIISSKEPLDDVIKKAEIASSNAVKPVATSETSVKPAEPSVQKK